MVKKHLFSGLFITLVLVFSPSLAFAATYSGNSDINDECLYSASRAGSSLALDGANNTAGYAVRWASSNFFRCYLDFDTSSIPDNAIVDSAYIDLYYITTNASFTRTINIVKSRKASSALATSDWDNIGSSGVGTGLVYGDIVRTSAEVAGHFQADFTDFTGFDFTGDSLFAVVDDADWSNTGDTANSTGTDFNLFDAADSTKRPLLVIDYHLPSSSAASSAASSSFSVPDFYIPTSDCVFASGCNLGSSGSLIITTGACDAYIYSASGAVVGCNEWSTAVKIPALKYFADLGNGALLAAVVAGVLFYILIRWVFQILGFVWRIFTFNY